ncbi:MAG: hypothetical protein N4A63_09100 [Vallitalea sp.]|jgi:hypothetical protein|nr:hypothetical protein [Vallitalea sp.]
MRKFMMIITLIISLMLITSCTSSKNTNKDKYLILYKQLLEQQPPVIEKISFEDELGNSLQEDESGLITITNNTKLTAIIKGNSTEAELYFIPTGSDTNKYQQLIASNFIEDEKVEFKLNYSEFSDGLGYVWIVVYNDDLGRKSEEVKIILQEE